MFRARLCAALLTTLLVPAAQAQQYRNVVNTPFSTISSGPLSAHVVDVPSSTRAPAVQALVADAIRSERQRRDPGVLSYLQAMRRMRMLPEWSRPGIPDLVVLRRNGQLVLPAAASSRASRAPNDLTFVFPAQGSPGAWTPAWEADLRNIINIVYPELKNVFGEPSWSGTVTILNGDNMTPIISDPNALSGGVYNASTGEILFQQNLSAQSGVLNLTQMLAMAFRGPALISYDPWERGMARAVTLLAVYNALPALRATPSQVWGGTLGDINVFDPLWHALDRYEWLNQPALGNDRFFPVSKTDAVANQAGWPNMLVPRLQMACSAWLKVLTEAPSFMREFNAAYYTALQANPNLRNNVPALVNLAAQALSTAGSGTVEGLPFQDWYRQQYALDTSVSLGPKLYAQVSALRPDPTDDDFGIGVILIYYRTALDAQGNSDEVDLSATAYPVYRDYTFSNRLFLGAQYEQVDIRSGLGTVAPTFFNTIGGDAALEGRMRVTMDFPVGAESLRIEAAPRSSGKVGSENNFWGVVVGADEGTILLEADGMSTGDIPVRQGAFGAQVDANFFVRPRRARLTFKDTAGNIVTQRNVVTGYGEYVAVFPVQAGVDERVYTLPGGLSMVAFPIQPLQQRAADALLDPASGTPLFNDTNLLMARWRQTLPGDDKYARYPNMEPLAPGKGFWLSLPQATAVKLVGRLASRDREVTVGLLYGWNQIGNPYETTIAAADLLFQYRADNVPVNLQTAIARGWVAAHTLPGVGTSAIWAFSPSTGYFPAQNLEPWTGYWIRVLVSEGLILSYPTPIGPLSRSVARSRAVPAPLGWTVRLSVRDGRGLGATAVIGQAQSGSATRAELPPPFSTDAPTIALTPPGETRAAYYADVRSSGDRKPWQITVGTPLPNHTYTLTWTLPPQLPRTTRLCLVDAATGRRRYMHTETSLTFNSGQAPSRSFLIVPEMRGNDVCRILNARVSPSRASGTVSVSFDVTAAATITASIRTAGGQVLRRLERGRAAQAGTVALLWDGRDDRGISVPAGSYVLELNARTDTGDAARVILPVVVTR